MPSADNAQPFATYPSAARSYASTVSSTGPANALQRPGEAALNGGHGQAAANFDALKRNLHKTSASTASVGQAAQMPAVPRAPEAAQHRYPTAGSVGAPTANQAAAAYPPLTASAPSNPQAYGDVYQAAGAPGFGPATNGAAPTLGLFGAGAVPQPLAANGAGAAPTAGPIMANGPSFSHPGSPYMNVRTVPGVPKVLGSPPVQQPGLPVQQPAPFQMSPNMSLPGSPNSFSHGPYAPGFAFAGNSPFLGTIMSPVLGAGMDAVAQLPQGFGMQYPMMGSPDFSMSNQQTGRTVYVGNLPSDASVDELLGQVRFGPIESIKILPEKSCAFISFLDPTTAAAFHSDALMRKVKLHDQELKIGWGKPSAVPSNVVQAVQQQGATRNVYLGNLDESVTEQSLRDDLSRFGPIDQVKIVRDKNIGFVHFLSIATAIKVVQTLPNEPEWNGRRVAFGKDRTAYVPKNQHQQQQHNMAAAAMGSMAAASYSAFPGMGFASPAMSGLGSEIGSPILGSPGGPDPNAQPGNRTIYLGNIHPETTTEEICNTIRGGILQQIRYIPDKHICFVTFVEPSCALAFYQMASFQGITLHNRRLKVGWGKNSGPTSPGIAMVVQSGGSRNVYVGNIENPEEYTEEKLRRDFGEYGDIELVNSLKEKQCCFVNFTNIANAIKAIEGMKSHPDYRYLKISFGKDRCGGAPRAFRGIDFKRQQQHQQSGAGPRSPFAEGMPFPDMGSPVPQSALESSKFAGPGGVELGNGAAGPGALEMDEVAAAASLSAPGETTVAAQS